MPMAALNSALVIWVSPLSSCSATSSVSQCQYALYQSTLAGHVQPTHIRVFGDPCQDRPVCLLAEVL
eukprot:8025041-Heterocapsa_arctica.AAC.1